MLHLIFKHQLILVDIISLYIYWGSIGDCISKYNQIDRGMCFCAMVFLVGLSIVHTECSFWKRYARYNDLISTEPNEANAIFSENNCVKNITVYWYVKHDVNIFGNSLTCVFRIKMKVFLWIFNIPFIIL